MGQTAAENPCEVCDRFGRYGRFPSTGGPDTMNSVHRPRLNLASRIVVFQLAIVLGALLVGAVGSIVVERQRLDQQFEQRALAVALSVAGQPSVRDALLDSDPS